VSPEVVSQQQHALVYNDTESLAEINAKMMMA